MSRSSFTSALASFGTWFSPIVVSEKTPPSYAGGWGLGGRMEPWGVGLTFGMAGSFDRCPTVTFPGETGNGEADKTKPPGGKIRALHEGEPRIRGSSMLPNQSRRGAQGWVENRIDI
ncbi:hypothetical protein CABS01_07662 [Colletotrichum abscissum]|uniref:Uncharacterized protein n=1 Tax=Colletotrichum tamarilloi TaxID=1209934 RepID=A0ABQ9RDI8_9PEZI|nr:uncharacterized protein CTAM01_05812 [Colletotrichum tamarilloi]XP_060402524.1 uncharacterized protein CABS01_07662 [Colletotrichum abscissum]KAK1501588.1 hypothetical protein CTAM01_05812 [Colletotrichum tamarilloi]KAK1509990.1 hypothetical protein CABS01_07662 [Colletotrichum abscissum]